MAPRLSTSKTRAWTTTSRCKSARNPISKWSTSKVFRRLDRVPHNTRWMCLISSPHHRRSKLVPHQAICWMYQTWTRTISHPCLPKTRISKFNRKHWEAQSKKGRASSPVCPTTFWRIVWSWTNHSRSSSNSLHSKRGKVVTVVWK